VVVPDEGNVQGRCERSERWVGFATELWQPQVFIAAHCQLYHFWSIENVTMRMNVAQERKLIRYSFSEVLDQFGPVGSIFRSLQGGTHGAHDFSGRITNSLS
jgi:hypothetical protein